MTQCISLPAPHFGPHARNGSAMNISMAKLEGAIRGLEDISLSKLGETRAQLLNRIESKHIMTIEQCGEFLERISDSYRVLEVRNSRISRYETVYFDNDSFITYMQHHNGKGNRFKLRFRHYESSGETYLEVKKKSNKKITQKVRMKTGWPPSGFLLKEEAFLQDVFPFDYREFSPVLMTVYDRFTLVSMQSPERITLDIGVSFNNGQRTISYPELVIAEVKHERGVKNSPALSALHLMHIRRQGFSKYCLEYYCE